MTMPKNARGTQARRQRSATGAAEKRTGRTWFRTTVAVTAVALLAGCASDPSSRKSSSGFVDQYEPGSVDQTRTYDHSSSLQEYFTQEADANSLAPEFVSEARIGMTEVETRLAGARAAELERDATVNRRSAQLENERTVTAAREESGFAGVDELKKRQQARQTELVAQLASRERRAQATVEKNARLAEALAKDQRTVQQDLISEADKKFEDTKAHIDQLRVVRVATEKESLAVIDQLRKNAHATRERASAAVVALRQEAQSASEKTTARVGELCTQLATIPKQFQATSSRLKAQAASIEDKVRAKSSELVARASAIERQSAEHKYNLMVSVAKTRRQQAQAEAERRSSGAKTSYDRAVIEVERMRGDAHMTLQSAQSATTRQLGELEAWFKRSRADIGKLRSAADRLEKVARAEFVMALTASAAEAVRETDEHQTVLSEAQMKTTMSEARTKAAQVHQAIMDELARQTHAGAVDFPGKTTATNKSMDLDVPANSKVSEVDARVAPEAVAAFRSSLAKVLHDRTTAHAQFSSLEASYSEQKVNIESVRDQKTAVGNEQLAAADALHLQAVATLAEGNSFITAALADARSQHDRAMVEADTFRRDAIAEVTEYRANAKAILDDGIARASALRKEGQVVMENGQNEVDAIQAVLRSTEQQGEAETSRLLAEANSVEQSEAALAEQIDAQIAAADRELSAELASLDRTTESAITIAETDYAEQLAQAEAIGLQAEMEIKRLAARNELERALAEAEIERLHDKHFVSKIRNEAEIERRMAGLLADRDFADAASDAENVAIRTHADMVTAAVVAQRRIAAARASTVRSQFDTRVVETDADRIIQQADALIRSSLQRANAETILAKAEAARSETKQRLARLVKRQESLQRAAVQDWDSRLHKNPKQGFNP